ncbi:hypothetical protein BO70DRAFT_396323 [Aspergillus heteromorphus CBS 117.55]|uniref:Uncharacterized protein n=1 Tax=Aspergillus heteromorphus CBS 117.55 TaxID=1448321 RepID=A0A317W8I3_9EURO|nr:uncharacterized protein BO70DRAFT_396323 [Aspergillus heteromorphus CBS 117.55]PWY82031.1 hypothetical protein BO70DRAFT_396323 [Aspergillus heteromorphus CBS 117.55]
MFKHKDPVQYIPLDMDEEGAHPPLSPKPHVGRLKILAPNLLWVYALIVTVMPFSIGTYLN